MKRISATGVVCIALAVSTQDVQADDSGHLAEATIRQKLEASVSHLTILRIAQSPVAELFEVEVEDRNAIFYVTARREPPRRRGHVRAE